MFLRRRALRLVSERIVLRLPQHSDFNAWRELRATSAEFLIPWEPTWAPDHLSRKSFTNRVYSAARAARRATALQLFIERQDGALLGSVTLSNIRRGPAQMGTVGYWIGKEHARQGFMCEAVGLLVHYAFDTLDLSRLEAGCLPENVASRGVLERTGFKYEGVAQSYLQINGRWRNHVLYANIRGDRRGRSGAR